jgi:Uma2 family endonuclease
MESMSTATKAPTVVQGDVVMSLIVGQGNLLKFLDVVPEPPGRIRYRDGSVTIVSPSTPHERELEFLDDVVEMICDELEIAYSPTRSTLFRRDDLDRGVMPDASYYIEHHGALVGVTETVDLRSDPPPDLVLEVVWTHPATEAIETLGMMGVPEVWVFDIPKRRLQFLILGPNGSYQPEPRSRSFPFLGPEDVLGQLGTIEPGEPHYRWKRRLREWVVGTIGPRRAGD